MTNSKSRSRGFGLIEVLVAVLVMALGMLGIAALQAVALRNSQSAYQRSQGVMETYAILDAMRANRDVAIINGYDMATLTCDVPDGEAGDLAKNDVNEWFTRLQSNLPGACARIDCEGVDCEVQLQWTDSRGTGGAGDFDVTTVTSI
jgi:type IV pilus assembly protein PilV